MFLCKKNINLDDHIGKIGIYFLLDGCEIVYIGQSLNIGNRIKSHKKQKGGKKVFTHFMYFCCDASDLDYIEADRILELKPKYNKQIPIWVKKKIKGAE